MKGFPFPNSWGGGRDAGFTPSRLEEPAEGGLAPGEGRFPGSGGLTGEEEEEALPKERMGEERRERLGAGQKDGEEREGLPVGVAGDVGVAPISQGANGEETCLPVVGGVGEGVAGDSALPLRKEKEVAGLAVAKAGALQLATEAGDTAELLFQLGRQGGSGERGEAVCPFGDGLPQTAGGGGVSSAFISGSSSPWSSSLSSVGCRGGGGGGGGGGLETVREGYWRGGSCSSRSKLSPLWAL